MTEHSEPRRAKIANCPVHGLHGVWTTCFVCGALVEQVPMRLDASTEADVEAAMREICRKAPFGVVIPDATARRMALAVLSTIFKEGGEG